MSRVPLLSNSCPEAQAPEGWSKPQISGMSIIGKAIFPRLGEDMRPVNGIFLYDLGYVWQLSGIIDGSPIQFFLPHIGYCIHLLASFAGDPSNQNDLPDSTNMAIQFKGYLEAIAKRSPGKATMGDVQLIQGCLARFQTLLNSELGKLFTFVVEEKRGFNSATLWRKSERLFSQETLGLLSEFVKTNLDEASKCLLLDRYTATGFHAARAVVPRPRVLLDTR